MDPIIDLLDPAIYQYGLYSEESVQEVCKMLRYCMKKHSSLGKYVNSIVFKSSDHPSRYEHLRRESESLAMVNTAEIMNDFVNGSNSADFNIVKQYAKIKFDNFNLKSLVERFISRSYRRTDSDRESLARTIYTIDKDSQYTATTLNENIDPDFKRLPEYFLNASSCHMLLNDANNTQCGKNQLGYVAEFILYGDKDTLIAYVTTSSELIIRWQVIRYLVDNCGYYSVRQVLEKILLRFSEVYDFLLGKNPDYMKKMIYVSAMNHWECEDEQNLIRRIRNHIDHSIYSDQVDTSFFQPILREVAESAKRLVEKAKSDALMAGMAVSSKLNMLGWAISNFGKEINRNKIWWEKEVEIIPKILVYKNKQYVIPDDYKDHPYKVTKLYISSDAIMYCEGKHPNVSGGKVCMGNLEPIKLVESEFEEIKEFLENASSLLEIMNYDSPHESKYRETFLKAAKESVFGESGNETVPTKVHDDVGIRQIIIQQPTAESDADDVEISEEVVVPTEESANVSEQIDDTPIDEVEAMDNGRILTTIQRAPFGLHESNVEFMRMIRDMCRCSDPNVHEYAVNDYIWICKNRNNGVIFGQTEDDWSDTYYFVYKDRNYVPFKICSDDAESLLKFIGDKGIEYELQTNKTRGYVSEFIETALLNLDPELPIGKNRERLERAGNLEEESF